MKTHLKTLLLSFFVSVFMSSCLFDVYEVGNGIVSEELRSVPEFTQITSSGSFYVYYEYSETTEVTLIGESNLLSYVETAVYENELQIRIPLHVNLKPQSTIEIYVKGPYVDKIRLSGSGLIHTEEVISDKLTLTISGSGNIETTFYGGELYTKVSGSGEISAYAEADYFESIISGSGKVSIEGICDQSFYKISGSGKVKAYDFEVNEAEINISGSGSAYLNVREKLSASISGSGNIHYIGNPQISSSISGLGSLICEN